MRPVIAARKVATLLDPWARLEAREEPSHRTQVTSALRARATGPTMEEAASAVRRRPEVGSELPSDVEAAVEAWMRQTRGS